jgi:hypothetical protein
MALVRLVDESDATGFVQDVYQDILATRKLAKVRNYWKVLAIQPDLLALSWARLKTVMAEGAPTSEREGT